MAQKTPTMILPGVFQDCRPVYMYVTTITMVCNYTAFDDDDRMDNICKDN